jgi:hypothetical protein
MAIPFSFPAVAAHGDESEDGKEIGSEKDETGWAGIEEGGGRAAAATERPGIVGKNRHGGGAAEEEKRRSAAE